MRRSLARTLPLLLLLVNACGEQIDPPEEAPAESTALVEQLTRAPESGQVHLVRLVQRGDSYAFDPESLSIPAGDVLRFVHTGAQPEGVAFDADGVGGELAAFILGNELHHGVLLTEAGQAYDVSFLDAPPGRYTFRSVPHGDQGMIGSVTVE